MRLLLLSSLWAGLLWPQEADLVVLVETSHLTCGKPIEIVRYGLKGLCGKEEGKVALAMFSRLKGGKALQWQTTPTLPLGDAGACVSLFTGIKSICDSVYAVNLLAAVEEAIRAGYGTEILVLASGQESGQGTSLSDIQKLAERSGVRVHVAAVGWLTNNTEAQSRLKKLAGLYEQEANYIAIDPASPDAYEQLRVFVNKVWKGLGSKGTGLPSQTAPTHAVPVPAPAEPAPKEERGFSLPNWVWIVVGVAGVGLLLFLLLPQSKKESSPPPSPPPPPPVQPAAPPTAIHQVPVAPPAPVLRRLIVYYPHTQQDVSLAPTTAPITIGRAPDNTLPIADNTVSSRHARLFLQGSQWYIQDLGSTNGTFVNEQRVTQHPVRVGDKIRVGAIVIQIAG